MQPVNIKKSYRVPVSRNTTNYELRVTKIIPLRCETEGLPAFTKDCSALEKKTDQPTDRSGPEAAHGRFWFSGVFGHHMKPAASLARACTCTATVVVVDLGLVRK